MLFARTSAEFVLWVGDRFVLSSSLAGTRDDVIVLRNLGCTNRSENFCMLGGRRCRLKGFYNKRIRYS